MIPPTYSNIVLTRQTNHKYANPLFSAPKEHPILARPRKGLVGKRIEPKLRRSARTLTITFQHHTISNKLPAFPQSKCRPFLNCIVIYVGIVHEFHFALKRLTDH